MCRLRLLQSSRKTSLLRASAYFQTKLACVQRTHARRVVNAGNANCATGAAGPRRAQRTLAEAAKRLGCAPQEMFVCSTGVIGVPLPLEKILRALPVIVRHRRPSARSFAETSLAICTTDTRPKTAAASFKMAGNGFISSAAPRARG